MRGGHELRLRTGSGGLRSKLPDGSKTAVVAITDQSTVNDADINFKISMLQDKRCGATCAFEGKTRNAFLSSLWRRETGLREVEGLVNKGDTVGVDIALGTNFPDDADVSFAVGFERAEIQFLFGNESVARQDAGAMESLRRKPGLRDRYR